MKNLRLILPLFVLLSACSRQSSQMNFIKNNDQELEQVLENAKTKGKFVFVDVYATWCGPCKWMETNTFKDARVAARLSKKFINYKVDGESFSGVNLALAYKVDSYPTYLFLDANGKVLKRMEGSMAADMFLQEIEGVEGLAKR